MFSIFRKNDKFLSKIAGVVKKLEDALIETFGVDSNGELMYDPVEFFDEFELDFEFAKEHFNVYNPKQVAEFISAYASKDTIDRIIENLPVKLSSVEKKAFNPKNRERWVKYWESLTGDAKHKLSKCIKKVEEAGFSDDPAAFCAALRDFVEGTTEWRGKEGSVKKQSQADDMVNRIQNFSDEDIIKAISEYPELLDVVCDEDKEFYEKYEDEFADIDKFKEKHPDEFKKIANIIKGNAVKVYKDSGELLPWVKVLLGIKEESSHLSKTFSLDSTYNVNNSKKKRSGSMKNTRLKILKRTRRGSRKKEPELIPWYSYKDADGNVKTIYVKKGAKVVDIIEDELIDLRNKVVELETVLGKMNRRIAMLRKENKQSVLRKHKLSSKEELKLSEEEKKLKRKIARLKRRIRKLAQEGEGEEVPPAKTEEETPKEPEKKEDMGAVSVQAILNKISEIVGVPVESLSVSDIAVNKDVGKISIVFSVGAPEGIPAEAEVAEYNMKESSLVVRGQSYKYVIPTKTIEPMPVHKPPQFGREEGEPKPEKPEPQKMHEPVPPESQPKGERVMGRETAASIEKKAALINEILDLFIKKAVLEPERRKEYEKIYSQYPMESLEAVKKLAEKIPPDATMILDEKGGLKDLKDVVGE